VRSRTIGERCGYALTVAVAFTIAGCGRSPITSARIENALSSTFANLAHIQVAALDLPPIAASQFTVIAQCRTLSGSDVGSGDWVCALRWQGPDGRGVRDTYDLFVTTDGCYTATLEGDTVGGPTLRKPDGTSVKNLLYTFEGCFDTAG